MSRFFAKPLCTREIGADRVKNCSIAGKTTTGLLTKNIPCLLVSGRGYLPNRSVLVKRVKI